jgi:dTMP kinase
VGRGRLITVEGIDGAGKTTLAAALARELGAAALREPGGVPLAERIRDIVKSAPSDPRAEALLFAAARAQLVAEAIRPRLEAGETLILDRFVDSSLAYQGGGRGLGIAAVRAINEFGTGGLVPDRTLYLRVDPQRGIDRVGGRGAVDRFEDLEFLRRVAAAYEELAAAEPERFVVIDAERPRQAVYEDALAALSDFRSPSGFALYQAQASAIIVSRPGLRGVQPSTSRTRSEAATSIGGSPGRRASSTTGISRPVTRPAASMTSFTENPLPLPRLRIW